MTAKTKPGRKEAILLSEALKALGDLNRLRVLSLLSKGALCVGEIEYLLALSQSNVSRHLDRLRRAGLVASRKEAQWVYYQLAPGLAGSSPALAQLITEDLAKSAECARDLEALNAYRKSGLSCSDLPSCRR